MRLCYTCSRTVEEQEAHNCRREYCTARTEAKREADAEASRKVRENPEPISHDSWLGDGA